MGYATGRNNNGREIGYAIDPLMDATDPPLDLSLLEKDAEQQIEKLRKLGAEVRNDFYSAAVSAYSKAEKNRNWRDKQAIDAYQLGSQISQQLNGLVAKASGKPVEPVVYICQHCGNACWYDAYNRKWNHRSPGPVESHEPIPFRFVAVKPATVTVGSVEVVNDA